jgi:hypothetical protein
LYIMYDKILHVKLGSIVGDALLGSLYVTIIGFFGFMLIAPAYEEISDYCKSFIASCKDFFSFCCSKNKHELNEEREQKNTFDEHSQNEHSQNESNDLIGQPIAPSYHNALHFPKDGTGFYKNRNAPPNYE